VAEYTYLAPKTTPFDPETGYSTPNFAYGYVAEAVEVEVDTETIPTALDVPERVEPVLVERPDPRGPWGARGMGEMPFIPAAPALIAAVRDATGVWFHEFPLTPERVWRGLRR
jgi:CO/xanthine dehydrogenase Mo-binding subunit